MTTIIIKDDNGETTVDVKGDKVIIAEVVGLLEIGKSRILQYDLTTNPSELKEETNNEK